MRKVISGCQTGVDISALRAAKICGFETGGWAPNGWYTNEGNHPEYAKLYGMKEHPGSGYAGRTEANVRDSDATIQLAVNLTSPGEVCTRRATAKYRRPCCQCKLVWNPDDNWPQTVYLDSPDITYVIDFLKNFNTINFAGNSERTAPGIEAASYELLLDWFGKILSEQT